MYARMCEQPNIHTCELPNKATCTEILYVATEKAKQPRLSDFKIHFGIHAQPS